MQGYHFPPPDAQPAYGYSNPQLLAPQQWPQHGAPQQPYEVNYQAYGADPGALQRGGHAQHQGYADGDADFGDGYYEDEEPRRGKRWLLIAAALIGAIGVGGALAYTYRSIVAPKSRLVATKTEPGVKVKVGSAERAPAADETAPKVADAPAQEDPPPGGGDNQGPRAVKTITIKPGSGAPAPVIPGITLYTPPEGSAPPRPSAKEETKVQPPPSRVTIGTPPPAPPPAEKETAVEEDPPVAPPSVSKKAPVQAALAVPRAPSPPKARAAPSGSGLGFVAVLKSAKTHMEAMTSFADLQQKYPEVLSDRSFDVQEADLSARNLGTMYRVVVGPPGSHNAASGVCAQLKAAGYVGCWVKEY